MQLKKTSKSSRDQKILTARHWWLMPAILAAQEAEIRRIAVQSQLEANSS
jgi:hypothetical protein